MLFIEIYFFVFIVVGKTLIALTLCFSKVFFRVLAMQIVSYSIRDFSSRAFNAFNAINPINIGSSDLASNTINRSGGAVSPSDNQGNWSNQQAPPYEEIAPPSYEEAIKSCKIEVPEPTESTVPVPVSEAMPKNEVPWNLVKFISI